MPVICANCGNSQDDATSTEPCATCGLELVLDGRYCLDEVLGHRGNSITYRAHTLEGSTPVVVKELLLRATSDMKEIDLFQREATILESLQHPGIPGHLDHFETKRGKTIGLYNVQEWVDGQSLEAELKSLRFNEKRVLEFLAEVVSILAYLAEHDPPVVHRDIKPANLLRRADGRIMLVDFGAARAVAETLHGAGSTVTGTFGYMAPEQLMAHAQPASDVYGLGATAIRLLTRREPHELIDPVHGFAWRDLATVSATTAELLDAMTAREPRERPTELGELSQSLRAAAEGQPGIMVPVARMSIATRPDKKVRRPGIIQLVRRTPEVPTFVEIMDVVIPLVAICALYYVLISNIFSPLFGAVTMVGGVGYLIERSIRAPLQLFKAAKFAKVTPGIVTASENQEGKFTVDYKYQVDGKEFRVSAPVDRATYVSHPPATELNVFYRPSDPQVSTFHLRS